MKTSKGESRRRRAWASSASADQRRTGNHLVPSPPSALPVLQRSAASLPSCFLALGCAPHNSHKVKPHGHTFHARPQPSAIVGVRSLVPRASWSWSCKDREDTTQMRGFDPRACVWRLSKFTERHFCDTDAIVHTHRAIGIAHRTDRSSYVNVLRYYYATQVVHCMSVSQNAKVRLT